MTWSISCSPAGERPPTACGERVGLVGGPPDLALDPAQLQLEEAHAQHRLGRLSLLLGRHGHAGDQRGRGSGRPPAGRPAGRRNARAGARAQPARERRGEMLVGEPGRVLASQRARRPGRARGRRARAARCGLDRARPAAALSGWRWRAPAQPEPPRRSPRARRAGRRPGGRDDRAVALRSGAAAISCVPPECPVPAFAACRGQHRQAPAPPRNSSTESAAPAAPANASAPPALTRSAGSAPSGICTTRSPTSRSSAMPRRPQHRLLAGAVGVERQQHARGCHAAQLGELLLGQRGAHDRRRSPRCPA